ncbi:bacterio-opsin activator, partial [Halobacteriales archaeon QH_7_66_37]
MLEFTIQSEAFPFGRAVSGGKGGLVTLERLVPLGESRIPFLWVDRADYDEFEERLRASDIVKHVEALTRVDGSVLYYVEWYPEHETFLNGLYNTGATILQAEGDGAWEFALRFNNPADLTQFHQFYQQHDFPVHIDRV